MHTLMSVRDHHPAHLVWVGASGQVDCPHTQAHPNNVRALCRTSINLPQCCSHGKSRRMVASGASCSLVH